MTNEEAIEILDAAGEGSTEKDWYTALDMGIAALKSQERMQRELKSLDGIAETCDKLEKALEMACEKIAASVDVDCYKIECDKGGDCIRCAIEYYKRKAGIDS